MLYFADLKTTTRDPLYVPMSRGALGPLAEFALGPAAPRALLENVEVLPGRHLGAHAHELGAHPNGCRAIDQRQRLVEDLVAPAEQQITQQNGGCTAVVVTVAIPAAVGVQLLEATVRGRGPAPRVGVVDDVVVHERRRVEDLE